MEWVCALVLCARAAAWSALAVVLGSRAMRFGGGLVRHGGFDVCLLGRVRIS